MYSLNQPFWILGKKTLFTRPVLWHPFLCWPEHKITRPWQISYFIHYLNECYLISSTTGHSHSLDVNHCFMLDLTWRLRGALLRRLVFRYAVAFDLRTFWHDLWRLNLHSHAFLVSCFQSSKRKVFENNEYIFDIVSIKVLQSVLLL